MGKVVALYKRLKINGLAFVMNKINSKILKVKIKNFSDIRQMFENKYGIEIGGTSAIFRDNGFIPLYKYVDKLDGCNFSTKTIWEGNLVNKGEYNFYPHKHGTQYVSEATDLSNIESSKYDFLISSNCLEHVANPLKAIAEWIRVLKNDGVILLIVPNKKYGFDYKRPSTTFAHLLDDFNADMTENDLTHLDEILEFHDYDIDWEAGGYEKFNERSMNNFENRALHHHVFDVKLLIEIFNYFKIDVMQTDAGFEHVILGRKKSL